MNITMILGLKLDKETIILLLFKIEIINFLIQSLDWVVNLKSLKL